MQATDFTSDRAGRLLRTPQGYDAFVPHPLPPPLTVSWDLGHAIAEAARALGHLSGIGSTLRNPHLLIRPFMRKEAVLSSRIEGTQASLSDLFFFEAAGEPPRDMSDVREVANYVRALETGLLRIHELPMSKRLLRELHHILMAGVRGGEALPGEFRQAQNWIGTPGASLHDAIFVPPPVPEMEQALDAYERFLNDAQPYPFLVWLAIAHYQFEAIHPFRDGNGRIGRLLMTLLLCHHGALTEPLLYLSAFFEKNRREYYERLLRVSQHGEWEEWIRFFLRAVEEQAKDAVARATRLNQLRDELGSRVRSARTSALEVATLDELFKFPAISVPTLAQTLKVTYPSALRIVEKFVKNNVLQEATGRSRNRIYYAPDVVAVIEA